MCHRIIRTHYVCVCVWNNGDLSFSFAIVRSLLLYHTHAHRYNECWCYAFVSCSILQWIDERINHSRATLNFHFILYFDKPIILSLNFGNVFVCMRVWMWLSSLFFILCLSDCLYAPLPLSLSLMHDKKEKIIEVTGLFFVLLCTYFYTIKHLNWFNWPDRFHCARARTASHECVCVCANSFAQFEFKYDDGDCDNSSFFIINTIFLLSSWHVILIGVQL